MSKIFLRSFIRRMVIGGNKVRIQYHLPVPPDRKRTQSVGLLPFVHDGGPDGTPLPPDSVTRAFHKLTRSLGMASIRLHDMRHTHATLMLKQGVHPKVVSERLGHSSVAVTLDTCSHVLPGIQATAAQRFDEGLQRIREETSARKIG